MRHPSTKRLAASATLHCLTGCAIGEILGLVIGQLRDWPNAPTIVLSVILAFMFGYGLSLLPLVRGGVAVRTALGLVLAADSLSILVMEVVDNTVMASVPGAMEAGLANPVFWFSLPLALAAAFGAAFPLNYYLLKRGRGHALLHEHHRHSDQPHP